MGKRLVLVVCALFVMAAAVPAFAAVQNIKVSGDILVRSITRDDFDLTRGNSANNEDEIAVLDSTVRLRVDADLTDNVSAVVRLINERVWEEATAATTDIDLDLAYITLKEFLYSPLTLTIGRQELHFGNDLIIGDGVGNPTARVVSGGIGTNQTTNYTEAAGFGTVNGDLAYRKAFDAVRATLNYDPLVIDVVAAKINEGVITGAISDDDIDLYGLNAAYQFDDKWGTLAEHYVWTKINKDNEGGGIDPKEDTVYTIGLRASTSPMKQLVLQQEVAYQAGRKYISGNVLRDRDAWAAQSVVMYMPDWEKTEQYNPTIGLIYSYFSGDGNDVNTDNTKDYHAWDPMFENQTNGHIINALFPASNAHNWDVMLKCDPIEDVTLQLDYVYLALAKAPVANVTATAINDYNAYGFLADKTEVGQELDINVMYDYTEDVQFGLLTGWFWPGAAINKTDPTTGLKSRQMASEAIASVRVAF